jgi:adenylate cyclase
MITHIKKASVMIADICGSTALYEQVGDVLAHKIIEKAFDSMVREIPAYQGTLINMVGDEILSIYPDAELALNCAAAMQNAVKNASFKNNKTLQVRIGVHYGDVILENGGAFGDTVNVTSRVAAIAWANQITTTEAVVSQLPAYLKEKTNKFMNADLKGKLNTYDIFLMNWEQNDATNTFFNNSLFSRTAPTTGKLSIFYKDQCITIDQQNKIVTLGRSEACDIVIHNNFASRQHGHCEWRYGKFILVDHSINGTYVSMGGNKVIRLLREEAILLNSGFISLGQNNFEDFNEVLEFHVTSQ